jgi:hypothetical protein
LTRKDKSVLLFYLASSSITNRSKLSSFFRTGQAAERFKIPPPTVSLIKKQFAPQVVLLERMTEAEKHKLEELQKRIKQLEKQLEDAAIKNITLETLVDVAEKQFNIPIRKKPGAKQ